MSLLEREALKYEKDGFRIEAKRTLRYGSRILLKKKSYVIQSHYVYLYYTTDFTTDNVRECLKDYAKIYDALSFSPDSFNGFYFCSGNFDKQLFNDLKQALVKNKEIRNNMKVVKLGKETTERLVEREQPKRKLEKETEERETETPKLTDIVEKIKKFSPHKRPKTEKELENMLVSYLSAFYPDQIKTQMAYEKARIDVQIGKIGIEMKYQPGASALNTLYGQVDGYCRHLDKVIVVIGYEKSKEDIESFRHRIEERGWLNSKVFIVTIR